MRKNIVGVICEIAVSAALGLALDFLAGLYSSLFWTQGGSISIAMVAIFIAAYRHGVFGGLLTGFLVGTIQILWGYVYGFGQVCLDYILPYTVLGLVGLFANKVKETEGLKYVLWVSLPIIGVCVIRTLLHVVSGIIYFETPFWASLAYNGPYMAISTPLCIIVTVVVFKRLQKVFAKEL